MAFHNNNQRCSGTIVEENWILTARSCLTSSMGVTIYFGMGPGRYSIYVCSSQLQCVNLQIMPKNECGLDSINERILCTRPVSGMSNCFSDVGNPLVTGVYPILVGLSLSECRPGLPAKFAGISSHFNWIRQHTGIYH
ncbi:blast:Serine proteases 1/2 [Drosophila guanche]|uniref:Blast:Serine proteases 1/2 n=1 Tax=Drosophila guanche TaxID=7266 RepID=A0A3B0JMG1_DROGU|nr:blast:Serine proteases 1/2 [Drosophila guanche]